MPSPTPEEWYKQLPVVTRAWLTVAVAATLLTEFGVLSPEHLYLDFQLIFKQFQVWRLLTCFIFFGPLGLGWLFQLVILVRYGERLERTHFPGNRGTAEYVFLLLFGSTCMVFVSWAYRNFFFLGSCLVFSTIYVWSRKDPYTPVSFFGFSFQAWHVPFVLMVFHMLLGSSIVMDVVGVLVGHLYHFLSDIVPRVHGRVLLKCPQFLYAQFEAGQVAQDWRRNTGHRLS